MPAAMDRACTRCGTLVPAGDCQACQRDRQREQDARRGSAYARGYNEPWRRYSASRLRRLPYCGMREDGRISTQHSRCAQRAEAEGRLTTLLYMAPAHVTDHIVPVSKGGSRWSRDNHQSLCRACNTAKGDR